jgi:hypothetical protein
MLTPENEVLAHDPIRDALLLALALEAGRVTSFEGPCSALVGWSRGSPPGPPLLALPVAGPGRIRLRRGLLGGEEGRRVRARAPAPGYFPPLAARGPVPAAVPELPAGP